jgi:hypothetical protein
MWFHCERRTLEEFGLIGCGEEFLDIFRDLGLFDYPRRGVSVRGSPALLISRKLT